jgi:hypothetical protein
VKPRVVFLGNSVSEHSVWFLRELSRLEADVTLVVGSSRARAPRGGLVATLRRALAGFTWDELLVGACVTACETAPFRKIPAGRVLRRRWSLACAAEELGRPYLPASSVNHPEVVARVAGASPDLLLVHSFSEILRSPLIETARVGAFNFHPGRLPENRGAHPLEHTVLRREPDVWTTCHALEARVDAGDIVLQARESLRGAAGWRDVQRRSRAATARALVGFFEALRSGTLPRAPQDPGAAGSFPRATATMKYEARRLARRIYREPA